MNMGFPRDKVVIALQNTNNNIENAVEWVFSHTDDDVPMEQPQGEEEIQVSDGSGEYRLVAFINHIGSNSQSGHYICHIKKEGKWIKYNDEKVEESRNPPIQFGYLYFFQRKD